MSRAQIGPIVETADQYCNRLPTITQGNAVLFGALLGLFGLWYFSGLGPGLKYI